MDQMEAWYRMKEEMSPSMVLDKTVRGVTGQKRDRLLSMVLELMWGPCAPQGTDCYPQCWMERQALFSKVHKRDRLLSMVLEGDLGFRLHERQTVIHGAGESGACFALWYWSESGALPAGNHTRYKAGRLLYSTLLGWAPSSPPSTMSVGWNTAFYMLTLPPLYGIVAWCVFCLPALWSTLKPRKGRETKQREDENKPVSKK